MRSWPRAISKWSRAELTVLNKADVPPFPLDSKVANEDLRLSYRYLDLRRAEMGQNLRTRHRVDEGGARLSG